VDFILQQMMKAMIEALQAEAERRGISFEGVYFQAEAERRGISFEGVYFSCDAAYQRSNALMKSVADAGLII
jgi:hypothetical protein